VPFVNEKLGAREITTLLDFLESTQDDVVQEIIVRTLVKPPEEKPARTSPQKSGRHP
jgi:hypothetical protein